MKKKLFFAAVAIVALASCSDNEFIGDNSPTTQQENAADEIQFGFDMQKVTRSDIYGGEAAKLLGNFFYVMGTKGTEAATSPTPTKVFDNYLVQYSANTAGTTTSNTANWEYVGKNPETDPAGYPKLSAITGAQTIKYWDYSTDQYDFFAFSTGNKTPVKSTSPTATQVGVTSMNYGTSLASGGTAYTFTIPTEEALKQVYITDITEVLKANYGKEVSLRFKNLGSKIRVALYETIPGYSVSNVQFYTSDAADVPTDLGTATKSDVATLISTSSLPTSGTIVVSFPHVGTNNQPGGSTPKEDYNKASVAVTAGSGTVTSHGFGKLNDNYTTAENAEGSGKYLGRSLPDATFAGSADAQYYTTVFPVSSSNALTLRVDYTLTATDGSGETITIYGAKASVPNNYTVWRPNYAYTYIFKISDATNGWTTTSATADNAGLYPITFDAVVAEATDATAEQTTVTTVSTPSITTYQQGHTNATNEYSKATAKNIYVQVMNTAASPASLVTTLSNTNSLLYSLSDADATEAEVMDALGKRTTAIDADDVIGRNGLTLTKNSNITVTGVSSIENGADNNPISITEGKAAKITIGNLSAASYAYVYDYTSGDKTTINEYQPFTPTGSTIGAGYKKITTTSLDAIAVTTAAETITDASYGYVYFSKTKDGTNNTTYSYISIAGKKGMTLPAGVVKVDKTSLGATTADEAVATTTFYFDTYISNDGKYAVKVIKVVN